jgi:uncharacterized protein
VEFEFDGSKNQANIVKHGVDMAVAANFDLRTARISRDTRHDYGEERTIAVGYLGDVLHVLIFTMRGPKVRVISLRKASEKEREKFHGQT